MPGEGYFEALEDGVREALEIAGEARGEGGDPAAEVEIPVAKDLADRVENLVEVEGVAERIRELEGEGLSREDVALRLAEEFAEGAVGSYEGRAGKVEGAVRTAVALLTEGVVAAPIEGIDGVELLENDDGSSYLRVDYAGPIRSAGGTAQALSVLIADYVRSRVGVDRYKPRDGEVERYVEEVALYDREVGLQYSPKDDEVRRIVRNCPVRLDGEPTTEGEVSAYRDMERIGTNRARGGMCLVLAEGIALKAPKIQKHVEALGMTGWGWIDSLLHDDGGEDGGGETEVKPNPKYLRDITAGRPILSHPSRPGGFRLRYGRARNTGFAACGVSPASMVIFDDFLAAGTQIKTERPGKAAGVAPVDSLEGPTVRLRNGEVRRIDDVEEARRLRNAVEEIIDVGEILVGYGEFLENNHPLVPAGYVYEWWVQELEESDADVEQLGEAFDLRELGARQAFRLSEKYGVPLHPRYTYLWHDVSEEEYERLAGAAREAEELEDGFVLKGGVEDVLEKLLVPHVQGDEVRVMGDHAVALRRCLSVDGEGDALSRASCAAGVEVRLRAPSRVGARMGRPEKSKKREMNPAVHCLFPIGEAGGNQRDIDKAASHAESMTDAVGEIEVSVGERRCRECGESTFKARCGCGGRTEPVMRCRSCGVEADGGCPRCGGETSSVVRRTIDVKGEYRRALDAVGERDNYPILKCVKGLMSRDKTPEPLEKGVLRAKHEVSAFKDGTVRYDMTDLPLTSFRPQELGVGVERLRELGYTRDVDGEPLESGDQLVELGVQDVVLSVDSADYLVDVAGFVDDLLTQYYGLEPYYEVEDRGDLVGELVMGLAPHTSAGVLGRVVGFTEASVGYAHPYFHAAKRRNCLPGDSEVKLADGSAVPLRNLFEEARGGREVDSVGTVERDVDVEVLTLRGSCVGWSSATKVLRTPAQEFKLEIRTGGGRKLEVFPDHRVRTASGVKKAREVEEGDRLLTPAGLDVDVKDIDSLNLAERLSVLDQVMIRDVDAEVDEAIEGLGGLTEAAQEVGISRKLLGNYRYRGSMPFEVYRELWDGGPGVGSVSEGGRLAAKRDTVEVAREIVVDSSFMKLLGYYLAEGYVRKSEEKGQEYYQVCFGFGEEDLEENIRRAIKQTFGIDPSRHDNALVISSRLVYEFFESLGVGDCARQKRVPDFVKSLPKDKVADLLSAYFAGDGSVERGRLHVQATSSSRELLDDVDFLLKRFGIYTRYSSSEREAGVVLVEKYGENHYEGRTFTSHKLHVRSSHAVRFGQRIGFDLDRKQRDLEEVYGKERRPREEVEDGVVLEEVESIEVLKADEQYMYDIEVSDTHNFVTQDNLVTQNCDGDEDCVVLLMDALLNFSRSYLPDRRGGRMDAPLVLTTRIDPEEIDDEAHNVDVLERYPLEFYRATLDLVSPGEVDVETAGGKLGGPDALTGFRHTHDTRDVAMGPENSAYKTLGTMLEKTENQLEVGRKTRAVDEMDVGERVIESHFLPDLIGNLRAFTQQEVRCTNCNSKYRRPPLSGKCDCGGDLTLTVHEGSVKKYLDVSLRVGREYGASSYTLQRLEQLERQIESLFEDDRSRQSGIAEFM